jgi:hypothetical protein
LWLSDVLLDAQHPLRDIVWIDIIVAGVGPSTSAA